MERTNLRIMIGSILVISLFFLVVRTYHAHKLESLISAYGSNLENAKFSAAEINARAMLSLSRDAGLESLAHVGVINFVQGGGDAILREVEVIEKGRGAVDLPDAHGVSITMASAAAMIGKKAEALGFLKQFCRTSGPGDANVINCLHKTVEDSRNPGGIMINAVELYEAAYLEDFLFKREHDRYYMLISAEYFDPNGAPVRFKSNLNDGFLSRDEVRIYCHNSELKQTINECDRFLGRTKQKKVVAN